MWTAAMSKDVKLRCSKAWSGKSTRGWRPSTQPTAKHLLERKCWKSSNGAAMLWEIWLHHFKKNSCFGFWTCFCLSQPKKIYSIPPWALRDKDVAYFQHMTLGKWLSAGPIARKGFRKQVHLLEGMSTTVAFWREYNLIWISFGACLTFNVLRLGSCFATYAIPCSGYPWNSRLVLSTMWNRSILYMGLVNPTLKSFHVKTGYNFMGAHLSVTSLDGTLKDSCPWNNILFFNTDFGFNYSPLSRLRILNLEYSPLSKWPNPAAGLFPDYMHIIHLAVAVDSICSLLLDLSDPCSGETRENKLVALWESYKEWADAERNLVS